MKARKWVREKPEKEKANEDIPDGLGFGGFEMRDGSGQLSIFFEGTNVTPYSFRVVLGKYKVPQKDGMEYYVWHKPRDNWHTFSAVSETKKFEHLLMAISFIAELKEQFTEARTKGMRP